MDIKKLFESLVPFIAVGIAIALGVGLLFMFFSLAIWGVLIGAILWLATLVKNYFFPNQRVEKEEGRIIEHDNKK